MIAHIFYHEMTDEIVDGSTTSRSPTTWSSRPRPRTRARAISARSSRRRGRAADVRVVAVNRGRADERVHRRPAATCSSAGDYDLVVKVHSKKSPQDGHNVGSCSSATCSTTCCPRPATPANMLRLFQQHPSLGMVFPPVYHIGYPTLGHAWFPNREPAHELATELGIHVPSTDTRRWPPTAACSGARPRGPAKLDRPQFELSEDFAAPRTGLRRRHARRTSSSGSGLRGAWTPGSQSAR